MQLAENSTSSTQDMLDIHKNIFLSYVPGGALVSMAELSWAASITFLHLLHTSSASLTQRTLRSASTRTL